MRILDPSLELELNKTGSFDFTIPSDHPYIDVVTKLKPIITVFQDDFLLFRGRVLDDETGWHNEKAVSCEGDMAFLLDSVLRPFSFSGTPAEFLSYVLTLHNAQVDGSKQFQIGNVTVEGSISYEGTEHLTTKDTIDRVLVEPLGGYLMTRTEAGVTYLDYLSTLNILAPQTIKFGKNLLDLKRIRKGADIATVIIPLGAKLKDEEGKDTEQRLTIETVNGGVDFLQDDEAIAQYGAIVNWVIFEDVTDPAELKLKGEAYLADSVNLWETIELTTADLAITGQDITSFHLGTQVRAESEPHGLNQLFLVSKLSIKLRDPIANKMTLGKTIPAFSEAVKGISAGQNVILQTVEKTAQAASEAVYNVEQNLLASIQTSAENIQSVVAENYYIKEDTDALVSSVSTAVEQTNKSVEIQFDQFKADVESVANNVDAEFEAMHKYIRFEDGNIIQGEEGSPFMKVQSSTRESYYDNGTEVAYFSNQALHVTDGEFLHSLKLGNFAFMPRENGNLSFKKLN